MWRQVKIIELLSLGDINLDEKRRLDIKQVLGTTVLLPQHVNVEAG